MSGNMFRDRTGRSYLVPFVLVTSLFFLWGLAHSILDVLNKHFQDVLVISKARSGLVQAMVYGGYFLMALPAGRIIKRWGYRTGIVTGLLLYGIGALMFIPGGRLMSFPFFLLSLFVIGCGLTCLETSANPYMTVLGERESAARRLNLAQSLNGLGWIAGPLLGGLLILGDDSDIALPYAVIGAVVILMGIIFSRLPLPSVDKDIPDSGRPDNGRKKEVTLWKIRSFRYGVPALCLYVAAQTGINSFFINYVIESDPSVSARTAALMLSFGGMGLFMLGRLLGTVLMRNIAPSILMIICAAGAAVCMAVTTMSSGATGIAALCLTYLFESVMFPTIFSMAISSVRGEQTKTASSFLIMSIVGGAVSPVLMGIIGESRMAAGFILPLVCFVAIAAYSAVYTLYRKQHNNK